MKKLNLTLAAIFFIAALFSCNKSDLGTNPSPEGITQSDPKGGNILKGGGTPANPAIVFEQTFTSGGTAHPAFWVMDANGSHLTMIYSQTGVSVDRAHWSSDGSSFCFLQGYCLYKLNVGLVNGVPTASNVTKLVDSSLDHANIVGSYWSLGSVNEIFYMEYLKSDHSITIKAISTNGTISTVYTPPSGIILGIFVTSSPDGSKIAFMYRDINGNGYLKVINRSDGTEVYSIQMEGTGGILPNGVASISFMEWSRTGSTKIAFQASRTISDVSIAPEIYTIDVTNPSSLTLVKRNAARLSWSPDDSKLVYEDVSNSSYPLKTINLSNGTLATLVSGGCMSTSWKK